MTDQNNELSMNDLDDVAGGNLFGSIMRTVFGPGARHPAASNVAYSVAVGSPLGLLVNPVADLAYRIFG